MYRCAACGQPVTVRPDDEPLRTCACDAPIVAEAAAACAGAGGVAPR